MLKREVCWVLVLALIGSSWVQASPLYRITGDNAVELLEFLNEKFRCEVNEFLHFEGKPCEPTCENPIRPDVCEKPAKKGMTCECNDGYVRNGMGACISPKECPPKQLEEGDAFKYFDSVPPPYDLPFGK